MRRTLRFLVLAAVAAAAAGCGQDNKPNVNSPGTTVYGNENAAGGGSAGAPATTGAAPSSNTNANRPGEGGIKPPTSK
jgi:hypothetical protein